MCRSLILGLLAMLLASGLSAFSGTPATAAAPIRGHLVDDMTGHAVAGATVKLRRLGDGDPGGVVDEARTEGDGSFSLDAGATPEDEYFVQLVADRYQGGYVGGSPAYVQGSVENAATYGPGTSLGRVSALPAFIKGTVVNARTNRPVRGVQVSTRLDGRLGHPLQSDVTDRRGRFNLTGTTCEGDCVLKLNGAPVRYENGYRACNAQVVPTSGASCGSPIGSIGRVFLDHR